ncbi:MAG: hypothetical protein B7Z78_00965 [Rhodospirillales bacterium 20-60-12]|nr:MAG: hypothetical protein B7Z78_00965 [Rhodospirillales bacterium 20-60-12]HQT66181.1 molybdopterin-dependent oxidoreductase [Acetobacteraceae bacterium]
MNSTCPYCGVGCGVKIGAGQVIEGDPAHPANFGKLCIKGAHLGATLDDSARLTQPHIGGAAASWDESLALMARKFNEAIANHGPDSVGFYVSGQFLTEDYYVANKLMKGFIGSGNIDTNSRLCMASSVAGHVRAFGEDVVPGHYRDIDEADLLVFIGSNAAWCHPVLFQRALAARADHGAKIIVIDPRKTATSALADVHVQIGPDEDVALYQFLLQYFAVNGQLDEAYIAAHTSGFAQTMAHITAGGAPKLSVDDEILDQCAAWMAHTPKMVTLYSQGVNQSASGTDKVNAIINLHLATGRIGKPGMGPFSLTGQPNAMGGREVGGLANQLAAHLKFHDPVHRALLQRFWRSPRLAAKPGLKAVDMFEAARDGRLKALFIAGTNPAESMPRADRVRAALEACPFVVVADCWHNSTTALADIVLPAAGWGEKDGTVTNSERRISRQRGFRAAPGEARPDWWMFARLAQHMGFGAAFDYHGPADIFAEHAALSGFENQGDRLFDISALADITADSYDRLKPFLWPQPKSGDAPERLFADGIFMHPDGKARFIPLTSPPPPARNSAFPYLINSGRLRDQWHSMTRTGMVPALMQHDPAAELTISVQDQLKLGVETGDLVRVVSPHGSCVLPVAISPAQRAGEVFGAMHWTRAHSSGDSVNRLIGSATDPHSGQPGFKAQHVALERLAATWHGIMLGRAIAPPSGSFVWSRLKLDHGLQQIRFTGTKNLHDDATLGDWAARLAGAEQDDERVELADRARGVFRLAILRRSRIIALLFIARSRADLPQGDRLAGLFRQTDWQANRASLLAGRALMAGGDGPKIICVCHGVSEPAIRAAIARDGLCDVRAIGRAVKAGTNCGSCLGELAEILRNTRPTVDA